MEPTFIIIDLFCGAGGTTTGFAQAKLDGINVAKVVACVNHDAKAIKSHWLNHPEVKHFEEDIRTLDLTELKELVNKYRALYPNAYIVLWASLECTNFSKAKGGQPRDADSRTLADHLYRYVEALNPDYVQIENVVEFMSWGPLDENGKPVSRKNGQDWMRWRKDLCKYGYYDEWKEMNSANFGAYTSRNRLFGCFAKDGLPIIFPQPTHAKNPVKHSMFEGELQKWKAVKEVLDFADEGESIFTRKKELSEKTLERIEAGLIKYVAKGDTSFIAKYYSGKPEGKVIPVDGPAGTIKTADGQSLVQADRYKEKFLTHYYGNGGQHSSIENPAPTIPTKARTAIITPVGADFLVNYNHSSKCNSIEETAPVLLCSDKLAKAKVIPFILNPSHGGHSTSAEAPCPVIVARQDKAPLYLVQCEAGPVAIAVYEGDSECMIRIKQFMAVYGLVDIKMRMLRVHELLAIQGFPASYQLCGNQSDQKKFIGNSVVPHVVRAWCEAMAMGIIDFRKLKVA
jgi:DNA (cytosine-5)-methyltransferase 1